MAMGINSSSVMVLNFCLLSNLAGFGGGNHKSQFRIWFWLSST